VQKAYYCMDVWRSSRSIYRSGNVGSKGRTAFCPTEMDSSNGGLHESQLGCSGAVRTGLPGGFNLLRILANGIDLDGSSVGKARQIKLWSEETNYHQHRYDDEKKGYYHFTTSERSGKGRRSGSSKQRKQIGRKEKELV